MKIGPVDTEIEINASKIYNPVGDLVERAKWSQFI